MINYLKGRILYSQENLISLDVGGIGFEVFLNPKTLAKINQKKEIELFITTCLKKEKISLYGFLDRLEKNLFELFINKISGIGPKTALLILDLGVNKITNAIRNADTTTFGQVPRLSKKMAQKIIIELKNQLGSLKELDLRDKSTKEQEAINALLNLGFEEWQVIKAINQLDVNNLNLQNIIKLSMKFISQNE